MKGLPGPYSKVMKVTGVGAVVMFSVLVVIKRSEVSMSPGDVGERYHNCCQQCPDNSQRREACEARCDRQYSRLSDKILCFRQCPDESQRRTVCTDRCFYQHVLPAVKSLPATRDR